MELSWNELRKGLNKYIQKWCRDNDITPSGKYRWDVFKDHIKSKKPFTTASGEEVHFGEEAYPAIEDIQDEIDKAIESEQEPSAATIKLLDSRLKAILKTAEFGSSTETTVGSTEDVESLVAMFLAAGLRSGGKVPGYLDFESLENNAKVNLKLNKKTGTIISNINNKVSDIHTSSDATYWLQACQKTAEKIIDFLRKRHANLTDYVVYRKPSEIYSKFNALNTKFGKSDKWNPADIWIISNRFQIKTSSEKSKENWDAFNQEMKVAFDSNQAIGISLKGLKDTGHANLEVFNDWTDENPWTSKGQKILQDPLRQEWTWLLSGPGSCTLKLGPRDQGNTDRGRKATNEDKINFRLFNLEDCTSFAAEVNLFISRARDGKAGTSAINYAFSHYGGYSTDLLPVDLGLNSELVCQFKSQEGNYWTNYLTLLEKAKKAGLEKDLVNQNYKDSVSKYLSLLVWDAFQALDLQKQYAVLADILDYALSSSKESAPFIKVF